MACAPFLKLIKQEIAEDPLGRGYASMTASDAAADLNELRYTKVTPRMITDRTLFEALGAVVATTLLDALEASAVSLFKRVYGMLTDRAGEGVEIGTALANGLLAGFVDTGLLTQAQADTVQGLAQELQSRAQQIGFHKGEVSEQWVLRCREV